MTTSRKPRLTAMLCEQFSGATLLAILLDRHPEISCDGEAFPHTPRDVPCMCGPKQIDCDYYRNVARHMLAPDGRSWDYAIFRRTPLYSRRASLQTALTAYSHAGMLNVARDLLFSLNPQWGRSEAHFVSAHKSFTTSSLEAKSAAVYVDGTKAFRRAALFAASGEFDMQILYVVRDGRGFCHSVVRHSKQKATLEMGAARWKKCIRRMDRLSRAFPGIPKLWIRYEDLCRDPAKTLKTIYGFLGVRDDIDVLAIKDRQHVLGNQMRLSFDGVVRESLSWQSTLADRDVQKLTKLLEPGLRRFNYLS